MASYRKKIENLFPIPFFERLNIMDGWCTFSLKAFLNRIRMDVAVATMETTKKTMVSILPKRTILCTKTRGSNKVMVPASYLPIDTLRLTAVRERPPRPPTRQSVLRVIRSCVSVAVNFNLSSLIQQLLLKLGISLNFSLILMRLHHITS